MDYFYDQQFRRYILQVTRMFGGFEVKTGKGGRNKTVQTRQVPVRYGQTSRMVNHIIRLNSENTILYTPFMSTHITSINMAPDRRQNPQLVTTHQVDERKWDDEKQEYTQDIGNRFTVKRFMPVPYNITFQLDIWTSNTYEKQQILEQVLMLFNPSVDLQTSDSPLDWTAITYAELQDNIVWSSKTVPYGTEEEIDVASLQFIVPAWISPPAEVTQRKVINTIIQNIHAVKELPEDDSLTYEEDGDLLTSIIITPGEHRIKISGNDIILLGSNGEIINPETNEIYSWKELLIRYGEYREGTSTINVKQKFGDAIGITGTFVFGEEPNIITWDPDDDDLYLDTLVAVDAIIDPMKNYPGDGVLPNPENGQRYLIADDISSTSSGWGIINNASINDIIEYDGSEWIISFDTDEHKDSIEIVTSLNANKQLRWDGEEWNPTVERIYYPGAWRVQL